MSFKRLTTVVLTCAMVLIMAGCSKSIPDVGKKDFMKACDKAGYDDYMISEFDEEDLDDDMTYEAIVRDGNIMLVYCEFEDEEAAHDYYGDIYASFLDLKNDKDASGSYRMFITKTSGYIIFNGEVDDWDDMYLDGDVYFGIYFKEDYIVVAVSESDKSKDVKTINKFLEQLELPTP